MPHAAPVEGATERPRCPACRVELRMRDDKGADPVFACPECQVPLRLDRNEAGLPVVVLVESPHPRKVASAPKPVRRQPRASILKTERPDHSLLLFGSGLGVVTLLVVGWLLWGRSTSSTEVTTTPVPEAHSVPDPKTAPTVAEPDSWKSRLTNLAEQIGDEDRG